MALTKLKPVWYRRTAIFARCRQPAATKWPRILRNVAAMTCVTTGVQILPALADSIGFEVNGTCVGSCDSSITPLPLGSGAVTLPVLFDTTLSDGDVYQISGSPDISNQGAPGYRSNFSVQYLGNNQGTASQADTVTANVFRSFATTSTAPVNFSTNHSAIFGTTIASGSTVSAADSINGTQLANYGSGSSPNAFSATRSYQITPSAGALPVQFTFNSDFAAGSPVGSAVAWNGAAILPPAPQQLYLTVSTSDPSRTGEGTIIYATAALSVLPPSQDSISLSITAPTGVVTLNQLAQSLGYEDFNWVQIIRDYPDPVLIKECVFPTGGCNANGAPTKTPSFPTNDPPKNGLSYLPNGYNPYPFVYDNQDVITQKTRLCVIFSANTCTVHFGNQYDTEINFADAPSDYCIADPDGKPSQVLQSIISSGSNPCGSLAMGHIAFTTNFVGVKAGFVPGSDCVSEGTCDILGTFDWQDNFNGRVGAGSSGLFLNPLSGSGGVSLSNVMVDPASGSGGITIISESNALVPEPSTFKVLLPIVLLICLRRIKGI